MTFKPIASLIALTLPLLLVACPDPATPPVNLSPVASFTVTPEAGAAPLEVNADASASQDPDGTIASFSWDWGDGSSLDTGKTASHTFAADGDFTVKLTVTDDKGATNEVTRAIKVGAGGTPGPDTTPPTVTSVKLVSSKRGTVTVTPGIVAFGVDEDANIVITFNEPMNQLATSAAYASTASSIAPENVALSFDASGKVLTINPNVNLKYSNGVGTDGQFTFTLADTATDLAGNKLASAQFVFRTFRKVFKRLDSVSNLDGEVSSSGGVRKTGDDMDVGDTSSNGETRGFLSFDLSELPETLTSRDVLSVNLSIRQTTLQGAPYTNLVSLVVDHVNFGSVLEANDFGTIALSSRTPFSNDIINQDKNSDDFGMQEFMLSALKDDLEQRSGRGNRSQFRLRFQNTTDNDSVEDSAQFLTLEGGADDSNEPELSVAYLEP
jgi:PKD repeat protein